MSSHNKVACPVCSQSYSTAFISFHVENCLNKQSSETTETAKVEQEDPHHNEEEESKSLSRKSKRLKPSSPELKESAVKKRASGSLSIPESQGNAHELKNGACHKESGPRFPATAESRASTSAPSSSKPSYTVKKDPYAPLAEKARPAIFEDFIGQEKAVGRSSLLRSLLEANEIPSMILWGPPGCGKTTLARIIANNSKKQQNGVRFVQMSATACGVNDVKKVVETAKNERKILKRKTILFIDEIHRFNKLQQDTFLPHVENGIITLIGATTENPSFQLNNALLSRCRVIVMDKLSAENIQEILEKSLSLLSAHILENQADPAKLAAKLLKGEGDKPVVLVEGQSLVALSNLCDGDARVALNSLQIAVQSQRTSYQKQPPPPPSEGKKRAKEKTFLLVKLSHIKEGLQRTHILYDRAGDEHYNMVSALQKSIRGCDDNAALYWLGRMLHGGEDPLYIARRLVRTASEDIGLGDPHALNLAVSTYQACHFIGMPECDVILAQCTTYLARASKSTEVYFAYNRVKELIEAEGPLPSVPLHLRNAPTTMMKKLGYGKGYDPASKDMKYLPDSMLDTNFFHSDNPSY